MPLPNRPGAAPSSEDQAAFRNSQPRRSRPGDIQVQTYAAPAHQRAVSSASAADTIPLSNRSIDREPLSPAAAADDPDDAFSPPGAQLVSRKKSLIKPERSRIREGHPNYHYRQHAAGMDTVPSTTGNDPLVEDVDDLTEASVSRQDVYSEDASSPPPKRRMRKNTIELEKITPRSDVRPISGRHRSGSGGKVTKEAREKKRKKHHHHHQKQQQQQQHEKQKQKDMEMEQIRPPSLWSVYCAIITFLIPDFVLACFGIRQKEQQRAWREKVGLISLILYIMAIVGFLTFGFNQAVCGSPPPQMRVNEVGPGYMIFHGVAYDLSGSHHPVADGIPARPDGTGANVLYDLPQKHGGQDGSFLFQNVNGRCKGIVTRADRSDVPTNAAEDLAWYFPCSPFNQDGSSRPNVTSPYYLGYACHTTAKARSDFYLGLHGSANVYFSWDDIKNASRNLIVYSGTVLDLDLLDWFDESQVAIPDRFRQLRDRTSAVNQAVHGRDVTRSFQASGDKPLAECLEEIINVGTVDSETVGCIASQVVLYLSLILILAVVAARFVLALVFRWFISRNYAAAKTSQSSDPRKRNRQIEDWTEDIYRAPPRIPGDVGAGSSSITGASSDRTSSKRGSSFLPTTSRFSAVYGPDRGSPSGPAGPGGQHRRIPTTMGTSQGGSGGGGQLLSPNSAGGAMYRQGGGGNDSRNSFMHLPAGGGGSIGGGPLDGFFHEAVVPQPPADWMPFGFPLAHSICLVTAYSEGELGLRTTLDSIAMTDYPNSHKVILVICDGIIKGKGELHSTPDIVLGMLRDHVVAPPDVDAHSYVAVASGSKRHNMAQIYAGFYDYGARSPIPAEKQRRVPMMVVVKCGTTEEEHKSKPGNRGKRDSQIILMSFLQKVMFDERMTELEYEIFNGLWKITGISPDYYEIVLMVDADTKVFPDSLTHMVSAMVQDPEIMGLCGETKIANKRASWVSAIQVFEYFISHHLSKSFESVFGGVTCLPGCFCMYRIKAPKGGQNYWVPILANPDVVEHYSENVVDTLHKKNLLLLGEDRYLTTLMLRTFPKRKQVFVPQAVCKTTVPDSFMVLLSQRRRWINSTIHNLMELVLVRDLCGTFCFSMQFIIFIELIGTLVLPAAIAFTFYVVIISIVHSPPQIIPLVLLGLILGLPAILIVVTAHSWSYVGWMIIYLFSLPVWNFILPAYAFWKFDDFSWGDTRKTAGGDHAKSGHEREGEFDSSKITMKRWAEFERDRRAKSGMGAGAGYWANASRESVVVGGGGGGGGGRGGAGGAGWTVPPGQHHYDEYRLDSPL